MKKHFKKVVAALATIAVGASFAFGFVGCASADDGKTELVISGSSSVTPLMERLAAVYEVLNEDIKITIQTSDSGTGVKDAIDGKNDFGMASRNLKQSEAGVVQKTICKDGVALVVNNACSIGSVTSSQIYNLYANGVSIGNITNAISREDGSGTRDAFDGLIKNDDGAKLEDFLKEHSNFANCVDIQNNTGAVKSAIAGNSSGNLIGYISMGSLDETVKALDFEGVAATVENVKNGSYKLSRPFNIVYRSEELLSAAAKEFINFILSPAGQYIAESQGYIAIQDYVAA